MQRALTRGISQWVAAWLHLASSAPAGCRHISVAERDYLAGALQSFGAQFFASQPSRFVAHPLHYSLTIPYKSIKFRTLSPTFYNLFSPHTATHAWDLWDGEWPRPSVDDDGKNGARRGPPWRPILRSLGFWAIAVCCHRSTSRLASETLSRF